MSLLRLLLRAVFGRPRRPKPIIRYESRTVEQRQDDRHFTATRQSVEVRIVEVRELRGRCWVIDGDTIDIGGTRIRLAGIDAPELDHPYGKNAKFHLMNLCKGVEIRAVFEGEQSHLREVATCYLPDGRDLSAEMVKAGLGLDWRKYSGGKYRHLETPDARRKLWRCDARQKGRMPPASGGSA